MISCAFFPSFSFLCFSCATESQLFNISRLLPPENVDRKIRSLSVCQRNDTKIFFLVCAIVIPFSLIFCFRFSYFIRFICRVNFNVAGAVTAKAIDLIISGKSFASVKQRRRER